LSKDVRREKDRIIIETQNADHSSYHLTEAEWKGKEQVDSGVVGTLMQ